MHSRLVVLSYLFPPPLWGRAPAFAASTPTPDPSPHALRRAGEVGRSLVRGERREAFVAPLRQHGDPLRRRLMRPGRDHPVHIRALVDFRAGGGGGQLPVEA